MLPQQTLMLKVAGEALDDTRSKPSDGLKTGVYIGITLDPNTTNYSLRWLAGEIDESLKDEVHPALTANRVMGSLGSIAASRVARFLGAGGPSFAVCDEEVGGLRAIALAVEALREKGCIVKGMAAIFTYGFDIAENNFKKADCKVVNLTNYTTLINVALDKGYVTEKDVASLTEWRNNPDTWKQSTILK